MRRTAYILIVSLLAAICIAASSENADKARIEKAVHRMLADYPQLTLQDIYKSFFQDRFGPGHMIADTAQAKAYLKQELAVAGETSTRLYEPTGEQGNYYRVSIAAIANGKITFEEFFSAFLRSIQHVKEADVENWKKEWPMIERTIAGMNLQLPHYTEDATAIAAMLSKGSYAVHHSKLYNEHYKPHYRIISRDIFENEVLPLLKD